MKGIISLKQNRRAKKIKDRNDKTVGKNTEKRVKYSENRKVNKLKQPFD